MVTYLGLRAIDPRHFVAAGVGFRLLARRLSDRADGVATARRSLDRDWSGEAALAALACCDHLHCQLRDASAAALRCDQVLCELGERVRRARALLDQAAELGRSVGVSIDEGGRTMPAMTGELPDPGTVRVCAEVDRRVDAAVRLAAEADRDATGELLELARRLLGPAAEEPEAPATPPAAGTDPARVAAWWTTLGEPERRWLITHRPDLVGPLDGVPAADRDAANRLVLAAERERLLARLPDDTVNATWIDAQLRGIHAVHARLDDVGLPRAYLLRLSTEEDGRAVIAVGNPDRATDVVTYVPGTGAGLPGVTTLVRRADAIGTAAGLLGPDHQVSVVVWLGYDPPDGPGAVLSSAAHAAESSLDSFADGLRATHDGPRSHNTVLGHSYGSLVAGVTARDRGLDADELVFVGSPGVGVDSVRELALPADAVWSSTATNDPVQRFAPGLGQFAIDVLANALAPFSASYGDAKPDVLLWHGANPSAAGFGANVFTSDPDGGHNGYWQGAALDNIARIALDRQPIDDPRTASKR